MPRISLKALIISNIVHCLIFAVGLMAITALAYAAVTIATGGASDPKALHLQLNRSISFVMAIAAIGVLAPMAAGYLAAKIAKEAELLHGLLSTLVWTLYTLYDAVWGTPSGDGDLQLPQWLDLAISYGAPVLAVLGAPLWRLRSRRRAADSALFHERQQSAAEFPADAPTEVDEVISTYQIKIAQRRRVARLSTGLGIFAWVVLRILLPEHERNLVLLAVLVAAVLIVIFGLAAKAFRKKSPSLGQ